MFPVNFVTDVPGCTVALTWKAVAEQVRVDAETLRNWTKGRTQPDLRCWPRIIRFLGYDPRPEATTVGRALKGCREGQGMSQKELAILQVDPGTLARWEREERTPTGEFRSRVEGRPLSPEAAVNAGKVNDRLSCVMLRGV